MAKAKKGKSKSNPVIQMRRSTWEREEARLAVSAAKMHAPISLLVLFDKFDFDEDKAKQYLAVYRDYLQKAIKDHQWLDDITDTLEAEYNIDLQFKEI